MKVQFENKVMSSLLMFVDHEVTQKGEAFTNTKSNFFKIDSLFKDYHVYAAPFKQMVSDVSVTGSSAPTVMTGIYVDGDGPLEVGNSGFDSINFMQGQLYFKGETDPMAGKTISGDYSIKDFNVFLTSMPEEQLLFETKLTLNPRTSDINVTTGVDSSTQTYPAIFIRNNGGKNDPAFFGGMDNTIMNLRSVVLADSAFSLDAVCSILKDSVRTEVPIIEQSDLAFNSIGGTTSGYNYSALKNGSNEALWIKDVFVTKDPARGYYNSLNPSIYPAFIDFSLEIFRYPRS